jgi:hypothetical protein
MDERFVRGLGLSRVLRLTGHVREAEQENGHPGDQDPETDPDQPTVSWAVRPPPVSVPPPISVLCPAFVHPRMMPYLADRSVNGTYAL